LIVRFEAFGATKNDTVLSEFDISYDEVACSTPSINATTSALLLTGFVRLKSVRTAPVLEKVCSVTVEKAVVVGAVASSGYVAIIMLQL
jgi:hypothetical protein